MNDADFEMLAAQCDGAHNSWLRSAALGHAIALGSIQGQIKTRPSIEQTIAVANIYYEFIIGSPAPKMDEQ